MMTPGEILGTWIAAGLTLMMFSFIYRDNWFFRLGEHLYLGISVGYYINIQYWQVVYPEVVRAIKINHNFWVLVPAALGILILLRMIPSLGWLSRMSFAFYIGGFAGLAIPNTIRGLFLPQLSQTLVPFAGTWWEALLALVLLLGLFSALAYAASGGGWVGSGATVVMFLIVMLGVLLSWLDVDNVNQIIILVAVFTVLIFFFFSLEHRKLIGSISRVGLFFIMISFGASFGYTVMARISLLIGRFQFLIDDWIYGAMLGR